MPLSCLDRGVYYHCLSSRKATSQVCTWENPGLTTKIILPTADYLSTISNTPASILTESNWLSALLRSQMTPPSQTKQRHGLWYTGLVLSQAQFTCNGVSLTKQVLGCGKAPSWQKLTPPLNMAIWTHLPGSLSVHSNIWQFLVPNHWRVCPVTFKLCAWLPQ